jgi:hypothetical protein
MATISALHVRHHFVEHAVITPTNHSVFVCIESDGIIGDFSAGNTTPSRTSRINLSCGAGRAPRRVRDGRDVARTNAELRLPEQGGKTKSEPRLTPIGEHLPFERG